MAGVPVVPVGEGCRGMPPRKGCHGRGVCLLGTAPRPGEEELCFPVPEQVLPGGAAASCKLITRQAEEEEVWLHRWLSAGRWHSRRLIRHPASL